MNHAYDQNRAGRQTAMNMAAHDSAVEPGKLSRTSFLRRPDHAIASGLVQRKSCSACPTDPDAIQMNASNDLQPNAMHRIAAGGVSGPATSLPFLHQIQRSFGVYDVTNIQAHIAGSATAACDAISANAYATGNHVAFRGTPDLHTAAHEAAHVVQQRAGIQLSSGIGKAGDDYERNADAVADAVVAGKSAEALLGTFAGPEPERASTEPAAKRNEGHCPTCGGTASEAGCTSCSGSKSTNNLAPRTQQAQPATAIQRLLRVENPATPLPGAPPRFHWQDVRDYIRRLSSAFDVSATGNIAPTAVAACATPTRESDRCLCDLHRSTEDWKITIDDIEWPHTDEANHRVTAPSTRSPVTFGAWGGGAQAGHRIEQDNARVLAHELCGHAALMERGTHPAPSVVRSATGDVMGRPSHDATVTVENQVATEMTPGAPQRGLFRDRHHGESFARMTVSGYPRGGTDPSSLPAEMIARLAGVRDRMLSEPLLRADIVGHADATGNPADNTTVSRTRAQNVQRYLQGLGVPANRFLRVEGHGAAECPPGPPDNASCRKTDIFMFIFQGASLNNP